MKSGVLQSGRIVPHIAVMAERMIRERFRCGAELRAARFGIVLQYEDIGDRLMELRKEAYDRYDGRALTNLPGHAKFGGMRAIVHSLRDDGDLAAAWLAANILREMEARTGRAA